MKEVLGFKAHDTGLYTALISLSKWITSIVFGFLCDYLINRRNLKTVHARKFFTALCKYQIGQYRFMVNVANS